MSKFIFSYLSDSPNGADVRVEFDDTNRPFIEDVLSAFEQFLLGVTYQPGSIKKYIDTEKLQDRIIKDALAVRALKEQIAAKDRQTKLVHADREA